MQEPIARMAARINSMSMDFETLHKTIYDENGDDRIGAVYAIQLPVLTYRNNKLHHVAMNLHVRAGFDDNGAFIFYGAGKQDVYIIRDATYPNGLAYLSLLTADVQIVKDAKGFNTPPYVEFINETRQLQLATRDVSHLLATWYASLLIDDHVLKH